MFPFTDPNRRFRRVRRRLYRQIDDITPSECARMIRFLVRNRHRIDDPQLPDYIDKAIKLERALKLGQNGRLRPVLIISQPKSATWYVQDKLRDRLGLDVARFNNGTRLDTFHFDRATNFLYGSTVSASHADPSPETIAVLAGHDIRIIFLVRDPRQSLLSLQRERGGDLDVLCHDHYPRMLEWLRGWRDAVAGPLADKALTVTFEQLKADEVAFFDRILQFLDVRSDLRFAESPDERESAKKKAVHFRKGATDEWRDVLTERQQALLAAPADLFGHFGWSAAGE